MTGAAGADTVYTQVDRHKEQAMNATKIQRTGQQPMQYKVNGDGYHRKNKAGRWVRLNQNYPQHAKAYRAAVRALNK